MEGALEVRGHGTPGVRPLARPAGTLRHLHEQLHGDDLDGGRDGPRDEQAHEDLRSVSATETPELRVHGPDHDLDLPEVPVDPRAAREGGHQYPFADRQLTSADALRRLPDPRHARSHASARWDLNCLDAPHTVATSREWWLGVNSEKFGSAGTTRPFILCETGGSDAASPRRAPHLTRVVVRSTRRLPAGNARPAGRDAGARRHLLSEYLLLLPRERLPYPGSKPDSRPSGLWPAARTDGGRALQGQGEPGRLCRPEHRRHDDPSQDPRR